MLLVGVELIVILQSCTQRDTKPTVVFSLFGNLLAQFFSQFLKNKEKCVYRNAQIDVYILHVYNEQTQQTGITLV